MGGHFGVRRARRFAAQRDVEAGHLVGEEGKILRAGDRLQFVHAPGTGDRLEHRAHFGGQLRVVIGDGIGVGPGNVHVDGRAHGLCHAGRDLADSPVDLLAHVLVQGAYRAHHLDLLRDDVGAHAAVDAADGNDPGLLDQLQVAADDGLQGVDDLGGHDHAVDAHPRGGAVGLDAVYDDLEIVDAGVARSGGVADAAGLVHGADVQGERGVDRRVLQHAFGDHQFGAALLAFRGAFLGRLEHELHGAGQIIPHFRQDRGHAHQDGHVAVVAAGVHDRYLLAVVLADRGGAERQVVAFGHRQAVHVGAQQHHGTRLAAPQQAHHAGVGDPGLHFHPEPCQVFSDDAGGAELAVGQFGVLVEVAAPGDHPVGYLRAEAVDRFQGDFILRQRLLPKREAKRQAERKLESPGPIRADFCYSHPQFHSGNDSSGRSDCNKILARAIARKPPCIR